MMDESPSTDTTRRSVLQTIGAGAVVGTVGTGAVATTAAGATAENTPNNDWTHSMEVALMKDQKAYHTSTVSWYGSQWLDSRNTWLHDVSLGTVGSSQWDSGARIEDIIGNYYEMFPKDYNEDGTVDPDTNGDRQGIYPDGSENVDLPEWVELTTDVAIGAFSAPAGFVLAADDIAEALQPKDGLKSIKNDKGFEFLHTPGYFENNWSDVTHFQRALYESGSDAQADDDLIVHGRVGRGGTDFDTNIQFLVSFWKDDVSYVSEDRFRGECTNSTSCTSTTTDTLQATGGPSDGQGNGKPFDGSTAAERERAMVVSSTHPREMTKAERRACGITKVDPSDPPAGVREIDGEMPSFVAQNVPATVYAREVAENDSERPVDRVWKVGQNIPKGLRQ